MRHVRVVLTGLGNVGRNLLRILATQEDVLRNRHRLVVDVVGVADSTGAAFSQSGLDVAALFTLKNTRQPISALPQFGRPGMSGLELVSAVDADVLLEATPVNLQHGQPGLDIVRAALRRGLHCVLANKGPLALAYQELALMSTLGDRAKPELRFSACVGGALPTINLGTRDLAGARITKIEAMVNGTCQGILRLMESGASFAAALAEMQRRGIVEADPSLDIDGWDEAVKLVIIANAVLHRPTVLADLTVRGIRDLTAADLAAAAARGERLVLLGVAEPSGADWRFTVGPVALPLAHPLARMGGDEMGVIYHTDISGTLHATAEETDATPTAAAMLRDLINLSEN